MRLPPIAYGLWSRLVLPTMALIFMVLGSIFFGIATPTEASGLGALGAMLLAALNGRLNFKVIRQSLEGTLHTMGFLFAIFIGATCFSLVLRLLGGDDLVANFVQNWGVGGTTLKLPPFWPSYLFWAFFWSG